ncbi:MAG: 4-alpha-glucanotransferase, partial [Nitrospinota bacterium]
HFNLFEYNPRSEYKISSYKNIENATHYLANENMGVLEVGPLSPFFYMEERVNPGIPSSRSFLNSLLVDVDELVSLIGDGDLKLKLLSNEFQEKFKKLHEEDDVDLKKIYELKREIFKVSYQYFRVKHLKNNTPISHNFFDFISSKGEKLRNVALFESLQEYFLTEDPNLKSWHEWPVDYQTPQSDAVSLFEKNNIESVQFYEFLQWQAESQLASAGQASWVNRLGIGILGDLPFFVNKQGAETWIHQNYYTRKATITIEESENETTRPLIPHQLIQNGYEHISDVFSKNMVHNGAIKIENIEGFLFLEWHYNDSTFVVEYPFEDLLGILALESQKNKCAVFVENRDFKGPCKKHLVRFGVFSNSRLELKEVAEEEEVKTFFDSIQSRRDKTKEDQNESDKLAFLHTPLSVYRVQFNKSFTFKSALAIVPYLKYLGITHCYASPILHSKTGSLHGYDTIDHSSLNPELGSIGDFVEFADTLKNHNMGLIVDIVPNHMGISPENKWWMDLLENGQASRYANFFDIDWSPIKQELSGKVLLSVLGDHYGNVLKNGEFKFYFDQNTGKLRLTYWDHEFPINPSSYSLFFEHRIELLESRLGATNSDFLEYASIMNIFKKIPGIHQTLPEKIAERNREKDIASRRLLELTSKNQTISGFIQENLVSFVGKADDPVSCNRIHNLLEEQAYRLAYWRVSSDIINYRRFFDVNELIC